MGKRFFLKFVIIVFLVVNIMPMSNRIIQASEEAPVNNQNSRQPLSDIENHWAMDYISELYNRYIINGYPDGSFRPDNHISRAEMAVILVNALGLTPDTEPNLTFNDSGDIGSWAAGSISKLYDMKIINGYPDGTFQPNKEILRCEIAAMIIKTMNISIGTNSVTSFADNDLIPDWAIGYVAKAAELKIINGNLINNEYYFKPVDQATRAEVCVMVFKMLNVNPSPSPTETQTVSPTPSPEPTVTPTPTPPGVNQLPYDKDTVLNAISDPWKLTGPGGGGAMFNPTVSYTDPNTAMITCDMTGTYITHDRGKNWSIINLRTRVDSIAFDPNESNTIYAASSGLFKSTDNGGSWKLIYPDPNLGISEKMIGDHAEEAFIAKDNWPGGTTQFICIDPQNSNNIYLGIKTSTLNVYYSTDKGSTWTKGPNIPGGSDFLKMYIDPVSPANNRGIYVFTNSSLYKLDPATMTPTGLPLSSRISGVNSVAFGINPDTNTPVFYLLTSSKWNNGIYMSGVMRSDDKGATWNEMQGLDKDLAAGTYRNIRDIGTSLNDARTVYVSVGRGDNYSGYLGMLKSSDLGETWDWSVKIGSDYPSNYHTGWYEREYDPDWVGEPMHLGLDPTNPDVLYFTGIGMAYNTMNGGATWDQVYSKEGPDGTSSSNGLEVTTSYGVQFDPFDKNHIVINYTDIGLVQSYDGGVTWQHAINGIPFTWKNTSYWMVFDPAVPGKSWSVWSSCHDLPREKMFRAGPLAGRNYPGGVAVSTDNMQSWQVSSNGLPASSVVTHIVLDPNSSVNNRTLYIAVAGRGVYKSTDDGKTWALKNNGLSTTNLNAWRMVLAPDGTLYLIVMRALSGTTQIDGAMYKSTDGADTWVKVTMPSGVNAPNDLISDPSDSQHFYLAAWPKIVAGKNQNGGLYETSDGGLTWTNLFDPTAHVYSVAIDPNDPSILYIVTFDSAAYMSEDKGKTWSAIAGYNFKWGHRPVPDPYNKGMLYITTFGSGVWYGPAKQIS